MDFRRAWRVVIRSGGAEIRRFMGEDVPELPEEAEQSEAAQFFVGKHPWLYVDAADAWQQNRAAFLTAFWLEFGRRRPIWLPDNRAELRAWLERETGRALPPPDAYDEPDRS